MEDSLRVALSEYLANNPLVVVATREKVTAMFIVRYYKRPIYAIYKIEDVHYKTMLPSRSPWDQYTVCSI